MTSTATKGEELKQELLKTLIPIFGDSIRKMIVDGYDPEDPDELIELSFHMLSGYMGESNARRALENILSKYPVKTGLQMK